MNKVIMPDGFMAEFLKIAKNRKKSFGEKFRLARADKHKDEKLFMAILVKIAIETFGKTCATLEIDLDDASATLLFNEVFLQHMLSIGQNEAEARNAITSLNFQLTTSNKTRVKVNMID